MTSLIKKDASGHAGDGDANLLINEVVGVPGGIGEAARRARAAAYDDFLRGLLPARDGVALMAVGGLGGGSAPPTATSTWCCCTPGCPAPTSWRPRSGIRSGTPACAWTTRCGPSPRPSRWPRTTSRSPSGCSTPAWWSATRHSPTP
ncbi:UTP-GlnB uridylyltransferase, GlnD (partial) [Micromonospora lupini str. Lupac 08]|uniref:UTP-GlnB uridylyltransferase, GlnD (Partial) n=1 Tax=Micromonospora lupini str. Lupac 08 TaxID=1150864 RepID=I0KYA3_9ACTN|nr:UTP-GlnB uridylyltransferase, GlnD (partial) [Micromonospora lupini str. Lupac 08]